MKCLRRKKIAAMLLGALVFALCGAGAAVVTAEQVCAETGKPLPQETDAFAFHKGDAKDRLNEKAKRYPASFDLRNVNGRSYVTPVKLQNPFGTCWGFAAAAAAESSLISQGLADGNVNLSEKHLSYFATSYIDDPNDPQNGEGMHYRKISRSDRKSSAYRYDTGGVVFMATSLFASGIGPILEGPASDPDIYTYVGRKGEKATWKVFTHYNPDGTPVESSYKYKDVWYSNHDDWSIPEGNRYKHSYELRNSIVLPSPAVETKEGKYKLNRDSINAIKQQMYEKHRALCISFCAESYLPGQDTDGKKYMSDKWAHYTNAFEEQNHTVTIVGWDDNYPKENFSSTTEKGGPAQPEGNGAFLIKNSWGSELNEFPNNGYRHWGLLEGMDGVPYDKNAVATSDRATGYFWISYYDRTLDDPETFEFDKPVRQKGAYVEQMDLMHPMFDLYNASPGSMMANVFKTKKTSRLTDISVLTTVPNTDVHYEIYLLGNAFRNPTDGVRIAAGKANFEYGGYHRISLDPMAQRVLAKGQKYSVVVREKYVGGKKPADYVAFSADANCDDDNYYTVAVVNPGESFYRADGKWRDLSEKDVQKDLAQLGADYDIVVDNFPIKTHLEPITYQDGDETPVFKGYLTVNNWQEENPGTFHLQVGQSKTLTAEFRGITGDMPDSWNPSVTWASGNKAVMSVAPKSPDSSRADIRGVALGKADLIVDSGQWGIRVLSVIVEKPQVNGFEIDLKDGETPYTGKAIKPAVVNVTSDSAVNPEAVLKAGRDYKVSYKNNVNAGTARVTVKGKGKYAGEVSDTFRITPIAVTSAKLARSTYTYDGKVHKARPSVVKAGKRTLESKDYSLRYSKSSPRNAGTYKVTVKGRRNASGSKTLTYKITKAPNPITVKGKTAKVKRSRLKKKNQTLAVTKVLKVSKAKGKVTYAKVSGNKRITIDRKTGSVTLKKGLKKKTYKVKVRVKAAGDKNRKAGTKTATMKIKVW